MISHISKICIFILVFVISCSRARLSSPWPQIALNTSIDNFITDNKNGSIYIVLGQNILKYSDKFDLLSSSHYANVENNRILYIIQSSNQDLLLACWQHQDLQCTLSDINSLQESTKLFPLSEKDSFKISEDNKVKISTIQNDAIDIIIATSRLAPVEPTKVPSPIARPAVGRFKISKNSDWSSEKISVLTYKNQFSGQNLIFDYIYVFNYNQYTYFILNDQWDFHQPRVRLARICDRDQELTSYSEITLSCNKKDNILAKYAFFELSSTEPTLHVAFEHGTDGKPTKKGTLLCSYDVNIAEDYVNKAVSDCNNGASDLNLLNKFDLSSGQPCQRNPSRDSCTSRLNPHINATSDNYKLTTDSFINIEGLTSVNFLHSAKQGGEETKVFFVGTESGHLTKLTSDESLLYSLDLVQMSIKSYHRENKYSSKSISDGTTGSTSYAVDSHGIVAVSTDGRLSRIDTDSCYYYTSCDSCLNSKDPLDCVWCGKDSTSQSCSQKRDCEIAKRFTKSCPPYIRDFEPKFGPLRGSSTLKIEGNHFGSAKGNRTVRLGDKTCEIKNDISNDTVIYCSIPPVNSTQNASLSVKVLDVLGGLDLKGSNTAKDRYRYLEIQEVLQTGHSMILIMVALITVIIVAIAYFFRDTKLSNLRDKFWPAIKPKASDNTHLGVSYRKPQPGTNSLAGNSINELVKINGSTISNGNYFVNVDQSPIEQPLMNNFLDTDLLSILRQEKILIDRKLLTLGHVLGSGQFGRVYKGFLSVEETGDHIAVAVKTIHNKSMWDDALDDRAFVEEGLMMKDFEHENVLTLIGVTIDSSGLPMVVTPFMLYGDLRSYISDEASSPSVRELIDYGTQIAKGMAYLANMKFVHRDLAARNCMLDENLIVKVADFGLSRDIYERDYYSSENKKTKLPVKWMAIESLERCIYSTKTDVWSYGVLLWELMTRGVVPYPDVDNFDLFSYLKEGRRMMRPRYCPEILYGIMLSCWQENPNNRPTFDELVEKVSAVITNLQIAKDGQQKVGRDETYCDSFKRPM